MSTAKKYARIASPEIHTARSGVRSVRPFDILRSDDGFADIRRHADKETVDNYDKKSRERSAVTNCDSAAKSK